MKSKTCLSIFAATRSGQLLVEVLVGMGIGVLLIMAGIAMIVPALKTNTHVTSVQTGSTLANELLDNVRVWSEGDWNNVLALATGTANQYYLVTASSPFTVATGTETLVISTTTYTRSFYVSDVYRDGSGNITTSGGTYDPSTKQITAVYGWTNSATDTLSTYLTRNRNNIYHATDWSGGASGNTGSLTVVDNQFATSTNIDFTSTPGSITIANLQGVTTSVLGTNISAAVNDHWAWNDNIGWIDFYDTQNIVVSLTGITGYASSSVGYVSLDCGTVGVCGTSDYNIANDGAGNLSGWAWNDLYGWISFWCGNGGGSCSVPYRVTIDSSGNFQGYAWNDNIGWIDFNCDNVSGACATSDYEVQTAWTVTSTVGFLDSQTFDTGVVSGAQLNSVLWHGLLPTGTSVAFQFAVSNASSGPWNFIGPGGATSTYWIASAVGSSLPLDYNLYNDFRYFRYRVTLFSDLAHSQSPRVDDVIINWSP